MGYPCIAVHLYVAVNNVKVFGAAIEVQQWVPLVLLFIYT
jgi:hypothetical protein